jgi:hypothetical protein
LGGADDEGTGALLVPVCGGQEGGPLGHGCSQSSRELQTARGEESEGPEEGADCVVPWDSPTSPDYRTGTQEALEMKEPKIDHLPEPILITGCARSGTSMVAGVIHTCGAFGGRMSGPTKNNEKGMFENAKILNDIVKPYLRSLGVDPLGQYPLPPADNLHIPVMWGRDVKRVIVEEGYKSGPWMYKGAKMCLMWPVWHYAFPGAKWIVVRRRTGDIVRSCLRTNFMRAFQNAQFREAVGVENEPDGWKWWVRQHEDRFVSMIQEGLNVKIVWPERMVIGDYRQMMETIEWLGLGWKSEVLSFIDPKLWRARRKSDGTTSAVGRSQGDLGHQSEREADQRFHPGGESDN